MKDPKDKKKLKKSEKKEVPFTEKDFYAALKAASKPIEDDEEPSDEEKSKREYSMVRPNYDFRKERIEDG